MPATHTHTEPHDAIIDITDLCRHVGMPKLIGLKADDANPERLWLLAIRGYDIEAGPAPYAFLAVAKPEV